MSTPAIQVEHLAKLYRLGEREQRANSLVEAIARGVLAPWHNWRRLRELTHFNEASTARDILWALRDVSFTVEPGEMLGIIGRNGAGKSTLLKILSRITLPSQGRVTIHGRLASLLEVGTGFHPDLSGRDNIYLNGSILGMSRREIRAKFDEIVAFAEIAAFMDTPVKRYSSGMYVRLAFAVAAHLEPDILIVDEVLAVGDVAFQKKCLGKMQDVSRQQGRTVLFVSHNTSAISRLTRRCLVLDEGKVAYLGDTSRALEHYVKGGGEEGQTVFHVENAPRKWVGTQTAKILQLRFERPIAHFLPEEDFGFTAVIRAQQPLSCLRLSMTIFSYDGTPIGGSFSADNGSAWLAGQSAEVSAVLPCPRLAPGRYYCGVGIGQGNPRTGHVDYDVVLETLYFEIVPTAAETAALSYWTPGWGRIIFADTKITLGPLRP